MEKDTKNFEYALSLLSKMIKSGANVNALDSYGNSCLGRAIADAEQMIIHPIFEGESSWAGKGFTDKERNIVLNQIRSVFKLLIDAGADPDFSDDRRESARESIENYRLEGYNLF
jgi:ankyrin repeat protein